MRNAPSAARRQNKDRIRWRGHEVTRIEAFSDAVFAFAVTLLIVSLEVPKSFDELLESLRSFFPFAVCFAILFQIWIVQNTFFRRFGLHDDTTLILNAMLLFVVLFFVYPLKFMFSSLFISTFSIHEGQLAILYYIYSGGFTAIYLLFALMYYRALRKKESLELTESEVFETVTNIYRNIGLVCVGIISMVAAALQFFTIAWMAYVFIGPVIALTHGRREKRYGKIFPEDNIAAEIVQNDDVEM